MIWALETWTGKRWRAYPGYISATRAQARRQKMWAENNLPGRKFRIRAYVRRAA